MNTVANIELAKLIEEKGYPFLNIPTIAEVVMWLYEKHGFWISVSCPIKIDPLWFFSIYKVGDDGNDLTNGLYEFNSPTEAYEAAIEYTLKHLL